jgi:hypothetical protein
MTSGARPGVPGRDIHQLPLGDQARRREGAYDPGTVDRIDPVRRPLTEEAVT